MIGLSRIVLAPLALLAGLSSTTDLSAQDCTGDPGYVLNVESSIEIGTLFNFCMTTPGNDLALLIASLDGGPTPTSVGTLCVGFPFFAIYAIPMPAGGNLCLPHAVPCDPVLVGATGYFQFVAMDDAGAKHISNGVAMTVTDGDCSPCKGTIGDFVWEDLNGNNLQDAGEPGIPGVVLILKDSGGTVVQIMATDDDGSYEFRNLCAGDYTVEVDPITAPPGLSPVDCDVGTDDALDSDCQPAPVTLTDNHDSDDTVDFGYGACGPCDGKVTALTMEYLGDAPGNVVVTMKMPAVVVFDGLLAPGDTFSIVGADSKGTLSTEIMITVDGGPELKIHTSCSQPIGPGMTFGDFLILAGASRNGGVLCTVDPD